MRTYRNVLIFAFFSAVGFLIYANVLRNGLFIFDDYDYILSNSFIMDLANFRNVTDARYIGYLTFALNNFYFGFQPFSYHLFNIIVHITNAFFVVIITDRLLDLLREDVSPNKKWPAAIAFLAGFLFLVHPLATQSVTYITQRFTSLSTFFYLFTVMLYLNARSMLERRHTGVVPYLWYALALISAVLGMKTKEITFTLPFALALLELTVFSRSWFGRRRFVFLVPFAVTLIIVPLSIYGPELGILPPADGVAEQTRQDKMFDAARRSAYQYFLTQLRVIVTYIRLLIMPAGQRVIYDINASRSLFELRVVGAFFALASLMLYGFCSWLGAAFKEGERKAEARLVAIGIVWFFLTLSIESSFIPIKDLIFEHRTYLPSVGFFMMMSVFIVRIARYVKPARAFKWKFALATFIVVIPLCIGTYLRNQVWTDELRFWQDVVDKAPNKPIGIHNRGFVYVKMGKFDLALEDMDRTIGFFRDDLNQGLIWESADLSRLNMTKAYTNRANILIAMGRIEDAEQDFQRARDLVPLDFSQSLPSDDETFRLAEKYYQAGDWPNAVAALTAIIDNEPDNASAHINRANAYSSLKRYQEAIEDFNRAIELNPGVGVTYHNRGLAYAWSGMKDKAIADLAKACKLGFQPSCESADLVRRDRIGINKG